MNEEKSEAKCPSRTGKNGLILAIIFSVLAVFLCVSNFIVWMIIFFPFAAIPFALFVLSESLGIMGLDDKNKTKMSMTQSLFAIILPIITIAVLLVLYSTNILVIRFM